MSNKSKDPYRGLASVIGWGKVIVALSAIGTIIGAAMAESMGVAIFFSGFVSTFVIWALVESLGAFLHLGRDVAKIQIATGETFRRVDWIEQQTRNGSEHDVPPRSAIPTDHTLPE